LGGKFGENLDWWEGGGGRLHGASGERGVEGKVTLFGRRRGEKRRGRRSQKKRGLVALTLNEEETILASRPLECLPLFGKVGGVGGGWVGGGGLGGGGGGGGGGLWGGGVFWGGDY